MIPTGIALTVVGCAALLVAERRRTGWRVLAKLVASTGFLVVALDGGVEGPYAIWILVGLGLSWVGDAALLGRSDTAFLIGLVAFLLGHVAYVIAFASLPPDASPVAFGLAAVWLVAAGVISRWLLPVVDGSMRVPVGAYIAVITVMVVLSGGAGAAASDVRIPIGAVLFGISDIAVARDRFVAPGWSNRVWGLPLYYAGQLLLALTVG
ncbi:MAG: lysoplasmalogenase [Acidimicrobiia bacterium]|nr:lysoplasmalogenase [Acidimicrobiia bacterium]